MTPEKKLNEKELGAYQKVLGYDVNNFSNTMFLTQKSKAWDLSFKIFDIVETGEYEIMVLLLYNGLHVRLSKFNDENGMASSTFDIVDEQKKKIIMNTDMEFVSGVGIAESFFDMNIITQWEIPILMKLCRAYILGDKYAIHELIKNYNLKIATTHEHKVKDILKVEE